MSFDWKQKNRALLIGCLVYNLLHMIRDTEFHQVDRVRRTFAGLFILCLFANMVVLAHHPSRK
ncbi:MAG TPA: hypothetical protein VEF34_00180 [Syntrophobacteraceae bacterium]|nr:hypothetical protein [Syntrophobacteraceae bacterium]